MDIDEAPEKPRSPRSHAIHGTPWLGGKNKRIPSIRLTWQLNGDPSKLIHLCSEITFAICRDMPGIEWMFGSSHQPKGFAAHRFSSCRRLQHSPSCKGVGLCLVEACARSIPPTLEAQMFPSRSVFLLLRRELIMLIRLALPCPFFGFHQGRSASRHGTARANPRACLAGCPTTLPLLRYF